MSVASGNVGADFAIHLAAAARLRAGLPIYQPQVDIALSGWPYVYSPFLAQLLVPLASTSQVWPLWTAFSVACWAACVAMLTWELRATLWRTFPVEWRPVILVVLCVWPAVVLNLTAGQAQLPLLALLVGGWCCLRRDRKTAAGILLGLAIALKPLPLAALPVLFAARQFRSTLIAGGVAVLVTCLSFALARWDQAYVYLFQTAPAFEHFWATNPNNRSLGMTLELFLGAALPEWSNYLFAVLLVAWATLVAGLTKAAPGRALALGLTVSVLTSPVLELFYLLLAYLPLAQAFADARPRGRALLTGAYLSMIAALYLLPTATIRPCCWPSKAACP